MSMSKKAVNQEIRENDFVDCLVIVLMILAYVVHCVVG